MVRGTIGGGCVGIGGNEVFAFGLAWLGRCELRGKSIPDTTPLSQRQGHATRLPRRNLPSGEPALTSSYKLGKTGSAEGEPPSDNLCGTLLIRCAGTFILPRSNGRIKP